MPPVRRRGKCPEALFCGEVIDHFLTTSHGQTSARGEFVIQIRTKGQCAIASVEVVVGDTVTAGEVLVTTELMKMITEHAAPTSGTVTEIIVAVGDVVSDGDPLVALETSGAQNSTIEQKQSAMGEHPALAELVERRVA